MAIKYGAFLNFDMRHLALSEMFNKVINNDNGGNMRDETVKKIKHDWLPFEYKDVDANIGTYGSTYQYNKVELLRNFGIAKAGHYDILGINYSSGILFFIHNDECIEQKINAVPVD